MTCAQIKDRTVDYLYGELPAGERAAFDQHLAGCDVCRAEVLGLQGTLLQARAAVKMTEEAPPPRVRMAVLEAARAAASPVPMAARVAPVAEARMAAARARTAPKAEGGGLWDWLRRPWLLPLAGAAAAVTILVVAKEVILKPSPSEFHSAPPAEAPAPAAEPVAAPAEEQPAASADRAFAPPASEAKVSRPKMAAPPRKAVSARTEEAAKNKVGALHAPREDREYAPPPPPRPSQAKRDDLDDALGGLSGAASGGAELRRQAPGGAGSGAGYLGGRKSETADKKVQSEGAAGPARDQAPRTAPAPVTVRSPAPAAAAPPPPAQEPRAAEKEVQQTSRKRVERTSAPAAPAPAAPAEADSLEELSKPAPAKARKGSDGTSALQERVEKANQAFTASRWEEAATAYRELLRLFPDNKAVPVWKARLRTCEQARLQSQ